MDSRRLIKVFVEPPLHKRTNLAAVEAELTLTAYVAELLERELETRDHLADSVFVGIEPVGVRVLDDPKVFIADVVAVEVWGRAKASLPESLRRNRRGKAMGL